ncbi:hypothetical protein GCM10010342_47230 [Streptomyces anulatus]|nr:hypothetical protein GCM10010342_47230 [Streptomyces anulatus]
MEKPQDMRADQKEAVVPQYPMPTPARGPRYPAHPEPASRPGHAVLTGARVRPATSPLRTGPRTVLSAAGAADDNTRI